jgi:hypothetical protein
VFRELEKMQRVVHCRRMLECNRTSCIFTVSMSRVYSSKGISVKELKRHFTPPAASSRTRLFTLYSWPRYKSWTLPARDSNIRHFWFSIKKETILPMRYRTRPFNMHSSMKFVNKRRWFCTYGNIIPILWVQNLVLNLKKITCIWSLKSGGFHGREYVNLGCFRIA